MACTTTDLTGCTPADAVGGVIGGVVGDAATSAWESVCKTFAVAATDMLKGFATAFAAFPNVDLSSDGIRSVYGISLGIAGVVAALLLLLQIARTVITHDGNGLAQAFIGIGKATLAFLLTLTIASASLVAADGLTDWIIDQTFGNTAGLTTKLTALFELDTLDSPTLMMLLAVIGIVIVAVLWFELLLRNAAVAVMIGTSPIAAAGMASDATKQWWSQLTYSTIRLIILKPVIALVFAVGFGLFGSETKDLATVLAGMLVLLLAALAWPAIGKFFVFAAAHSGGPSGLAAVLGFAAGRASEAAGGMPAGVEPDQFGQHAENRTMASFAARGASTGASSGAAGSAAAGGAGAAAGGAAAAAGAAPVMVAVKGLQMAQRAVNSLVGRMEQTAGHAGLPGANHHAAPAGHVRYVPTTAGTATRPSNGGGGGGGGGGGQAEPPGTTATGGDASAPTTAPASVPTDLPPTAPAPNGPDAGPGPGGDAPAPAAAPPDTGELAPSTAAAPSPASVSEPAAPIAEPPAASNAPAPASAASAPSAAPSPAVQQEPSAPPAPAAQPSPSSAPSPAAPQTPSGGQQASPGAVPPVVPQPRSAPQSERARPQQSSPDSSKGDLS